MKFLTTLFWWALLAGGLAGLGVQPVPPGRTATRDGATLGPGLWFHVPQLWPATLQPRPEPKGHAGERPDPSALARSVAALQTQAEALRADLKANLAAASAAQEAAARAAGEARAAAERARAALLAEADTEAARLLAEAEAEADRVEAEGEADHIRTVAEAELTLARAEAERDRLLAAALAGEGGRYHAAIEAARAFQLGDLRLETHDPEFLKKFGSMAAWRRFFLGD